MGVESSETKNLAYLKQVGFQIRLGAAAQNHNERKLLTNSTKIQVKKEKEKRMKNQHQEKTKGRDGKQHTHLEGCCL